MAAFRARDVFQTRAPAEVDTPPAAEPAPEASPTEEGEAPAPEQQGPRKPGQASKIKKDVGGDAKRYGGKLGKLAHVSDPAGAIAGVLAYALIINGIRYGTPGITGWLKAKFLNQPMQGQAVNALAPTKNGGTLAA